MNGQGLDLRDLAALDALVTHQSVTKAAQALGVSQPTMSRQLAKLREALDDQLLVRSGHKMVPTTRAKKIAEVARQAVFSLERVVSRERFEPRASQRRFSLQAWDYTQLLILPGLLQRLREHAPGAALAVMPMAARSPVDALETNAVELSVGLHRNLRDGYMRRGLFQDEFRLCARSDHSIWQAPLTPHRYAAQPHLLVAPFGPTDAGAVDLALRALGLSRQVHAFVPSFVAAPQLLRDSDLIATLPKRLLDRLAPDLRQAAPPVPLPDYTIEAVWHAAQDADPGHRWFREQLAAVSAAL